MFFKIFISQKAKILSEPFTVKLYLSIKIFIGN